MCNEPAGELGGDGLGRVRYHDGELIATKPGDRVRRARTSRQPRGDLGQQQITDGVPHLVVHRLEPVEINIEQGHAFIGPLGVGDGQRTS